MKPQQPLLSPAVHAAAVAAALAVVASTVAFAGRASEDAVHYAQAALAPAAHDAMPQRVEVATRRGGERLADACSGPQPRT